PVAQPLEREELTPGRGPPSPTSTVNGSCGPMRQSLYGHRMISGAVDRGRPLPRPEPDRPSWTLVFRGMKAHHRIEPRTPADPARCAFSCGKHGPEPMPAAERWLLSVCYEKADLAERAEDRRWGGPWARRTRGTGTVRRPARARLTDHRLR